MESLVQSVLVLLIFSGFEIDCQLNPRGSVHQESPFSLDADNNPVSELQNTQPQSDYPYSYPFYSPWTYPLYQHAGIPPPPYFGGPPPQYAYPYPWNPPPQIPYQPPAAPNFQMPQVQPMQELINLGSQSPTTPPCATILTTSNCILRVPDDGLHKDISKRSFVFAAGLIKEQCSLTVQDCSGSYFTSSNFLFSSGGSCITASSVCCECFGCARGSFNLYENSCAILFENVKCSTCSGFRLEVADGDTVSVMNPIVYDKVSSIYVLPDCELNVFTRPDFQGDAAIAQGSFDDLPYEWNDEISSYKCSCPRKSSPAPTEEPSQTQGTLYPIETTIAIQTTQPSTILPPSTSSTFKSTSGISISTTTTAMPDKTTQIITTGPPETTVAPSSTTVKPVTDPEISTTPKPDLTTKTDPEVITKPEIATTTQLEIITTTLASKPEITTTPQFETCEPVC